MKVSRGTWMFATYFATCRQNLYPHFTCVCKNYERVLKTNEDIVPMIMTRDARIESMFSFKYDHNQGLIKHKKNYIDLNLTVRCEDCCDIHIPKHWRFQIKS